MSFGHGKAAVVLMSGVNMSNYLKSFEAPQSADTAETTVFNSSGAKSYVPGNKDATLSGEGIFDAANIDNTLKTALGSTTPKVWTYWPQGASTGSYGYGLKTYQTAYNITSPVEDVVSLSVEGQSKVGSDRVVSLFNLSNIASSCGNGNNNNYGAASTKGGVGYIQRTDTGTRMLTPIIQHSSAGSSWATLLSFTASTGKGGERVDVSGSVKQYTRLKYNISSGSTKAVTVNVGFSRR